MTFEQIYRESQSNDWYRDIEQNLSEYTNQISLAIIGEQYPDFKMLNESEMTNSDYIDHLANAQKSYDHIKRNIALTESINIDISTASSVTTRINQNTASIKSLETDLNSEEDAFKKYVLRGAILAYKSLLEQIIDSINTYNTNNNVSIPLPRSW